MDAYSDIEHDGFTVFDPFCGTSRIPLSKSRAGSIASTWENTSNKGEESSAFLIEHFCQHKWRLIEQKWATV